MTDKLKWCKEKGIRLSKPNKSVSEAYMLKAKNPPVAVRNEEDNPEWQITAGYYAIYFSVYAILMKIGIKSEIHSCTLELFEHLLGKYFNDEEVKLFKDAMQARINVQYYITSKRELQENIKFLEKIEELHNKCMQIKLDNLTIEKIRSQIRIL